MNVIKTFLLTLPLVLCCSCGSLTKTTNPQTGAIVYAPSPAFSNTVSKIQGVIGAVPDEIPYAPYAKDAALALLGLATTAVTIYAKAKSSQAATQTQAADLLAATVVKTSNASVALQVSSGTGAHQAVAQHIDNNTV